MGRGSVPRRRSPIDDVSSRGDRVWQDDHTSDFRISKQRATSPPRGRHYGRDESSHHKPRPYTREESSYAGERRFARDESSYRPRRGLSPRRQDSEKGYVIKKQKSRSMDDTTTRPSESTARFELMETIGKGAYSWVRRARDRVTNKMVVIKFMRHASGRERQYQKQQVKTEIDAMVRLQHPRFARILSYNMNHTYRDVGGRTFKTIMIVMDFYEKGELFDILYYSKKKSKGLDKRAVLTYTRQLVEGISTMHQRGIIHRDIKLQNLLLDEDYNMRITDFGLAKLLEKGRDAERVTMNTSHVGTKGYKAPELIEGRSFTHKVDYFAIGVALFVMLAGFPPCTMASKRDKWYEPLYRGDAATFWRYHRKSGIPDEAKPLLTGLLTRDPAKRFGYKEIIADDWYRNGAVLSKGQFGRLMETRYEESVRGRSMDDKRRYDEDGSVLADMPRVKTSRSSYAGYRGEVML